MDKFQSLLGQLENAKGASSADHFLIAVQQTKSHLNLINKLVRLPPFKALPKPARKERQKKIKDGVVKVLRLLTSRSTTSVNSECLLSMVGNLVKAEKEKVKVAVLSNMLELLFRGLLMFVELQ